MHPNPAFRGASRDENLGFARDRGFGVLMVNGDPFPLCSHVPFLLADDGKSAEMHLVRSNPILGCLADGGVAARMAVSGPDGYVSPDWYGMPDQVPTWNYVAVHLSGRLHALPSDELSGHLERLSRFFEARLAPKPPWGLGKQGLVRSIGADDADDCSGQAGCRKGRGDVEVFAEQAG